MTSRCVDAEKKRKLRGIYLRGEVYWFTKQVNGRRSHVSLETRNYAEAVQRAQEILNRPELQPARTLPARTVVAAPCCPRNWQPLQARSRA